MNSAKGWFAKRFVYCETKFRFDCVVCNKKMWFPKSKLGKYLTCSSDCSTKRKLQIFQSRSRVCKSCKNTFFPRPSQISSGRGVFCSQKCNSASHMAMNTKNAKEKAAKSFLKAIEEGRYVPPRGEDHSRWKGGAGEYRKRRQDSGAATNYLRKWRSENPCKRRQQILRRKGKKIGRLPAGTVESIGNHQRWKCVVCKKNIKKSFHLDHIFPLSKGGVHLPSNVQLLCPSCNLRKSAKDPIVFMQERGFLF